MKWTSEAGPRQNKKVQKAISAFMYKAKSHTEITGVIGKPETEHRATYMLPMSNMNDYAEEKFKAVGESFNWTITRANYKSVIAAVEAASEDVGKNLPVVDNRKTEEQAAADERMVAEVDRERKKKQAEKRNNPTEYIPCTSVAKIIRTKLKEKYPGQKFSVRSDNNSIRIGWEDGPSQEEVDDIVQAYNGAGFDGMTDLEYLKDHWVLPDGTVQLAHSPGSYGSVPAESNPKPCPDAKRVHCGSKYIFTSRILSDDAAKEVERLFKEEYGREYNKNDSSDWHWYNEILKTFSRYKRPDKKKTETVTSAEGFTVREGLREGFVEIIFVDKPDADTITELKANRFRYTRKGGEPRWWGKECNLPARFKQGDAEQKQEEEKEQEEPVKMEQNIRFPWKSKASENSNYLSDGHVLVLKCFMKPHSEIVVTADKDHVTDDVILKVIDREMNGELVPVTEFRDHEKDSRLLTAHTDSTQCDIQKDQLRWIEKNVVYDEIKTCAKTGRSIVFTNNGELAAVFTTLYKTFKHTKSTTVIKQEQPKRKVDEVLGEAVRRLAELQRNAAEKCLR